MDAQYNIYRFICENGSHRCVYGSLQHGLYTKEYDFCDECASANAVSWYRIRGLKSTAAVDRTKTLVDLPWCMMQG